MVRLSMMENLPIGHLPDHHRVMAPTIEAWQWQLDAACRGTSSEVFFSPSGEGRTARRVREEQAKALCAECPVLTQCRLFALSSNEPFGVWGGTTARERALERARAQRAG